MNIAQISFFTDRESRPPEQLLEVWPSLVDVAEAAASAGARVTVIQASQFTHTLARNSVNYHFLPFGHSEGGHPQPEAFRELVRGVSPDVCHVHGLCFPRDVLSLAALLPNIPILLQDHANQPPRFWRRRLWQRSFTVASGIAFCASDQAQPFTRLRMIPAQTQIFDVPESTSRFTPGDHESARSATNTSGDPMILWVGHLDANKDPLTVLDGISAATRSLPGLQLWCCFGTGPLLPAIQQRVATDPALQGRVHLLGRVPHETIEHLMRAADLFVLGSRREGSGYSVIEALACGLTPVVTDIPSFRLLTGGGSIGALWPCGDSAKLRDALVATAIRPQPALRAAARAHFERELSFEAVGRKLVRVYEHLIRRKVSALSGAA